MDRHAALGLGDLVLARLGNAPPDLIGIGGAVAVGKSTIANALADALRQRGRHVDVVSTDAFLLPNAILAEGDLMYRKGFPESYDKSALSAFLEAVGAGATRLEIPVYSHTTYDIAAGERVAIADPDIVVVEGVVALQPPARDLIDVAIYIDADEADVRAWFAERFVRLTDEARSGAESFYRLFVEMSDERVRAVAEGTWDAINGPNLHDHIAPSRSRADLVVSKDADHTIRAVIET